MVGKTPRAHLVYGEVQDGLVFIDEEETHDLVQLHRDLGRARTWGEFATFDLESSGLRCDTVRYMKHCVERERCYRASRGRISLNRNRRAAARGLSRSLLAV